MFTPGGQPDLHSRAAYGGKGGGSSPAPVYQYTPPPPTVLSDPVSGASFIQSYDQTGQPLGMSASDQLNAEIAQRQASEKAASDAATQQANADAAQKEQTFQGNRQAAYNTAMQNVMRQFQLQGVDPQQYMSSDITPALQRQFQSVQDLDPNPTAAFPTSLGDTIISNILSGKRTQASNALNNIFTPTYAQDQLPDSLTGNYANTIVNEQFDPLMAQLTNAQKRGTLVGPGYDAAVNALNQKKSAALSTVNTLGGNILAGDRSSLNDYISGARNDVSNLSLAGNFDPNSYSSAASGKVASDIGNFGGALRSAVGDTKFADITDLLNTGGAVQGSQNPSITNPAGATTTATGGGALSPAFVPPDELARRQRGLGSTGAF